MTSYLLADVGQSGTRLRIQTPSARSIEDRSDGVRADHVAEDHLVDVVGEAITRHRVSIDLVCAGLSGLQGARADTSGLLHRWAGLGIRGVVVADDSVTGYLGALGTGPGIGLSVGTGVVALATSPAGGWARSNGWGHLLGDQGGGYWIGKAGLEAAMRAVDRRGPDTALRALAAAQFGSPERIGTVLQRDPQRVRRIASFARQVLEATGTDPVAQQICAAAGGELAQAAAAAAEGAGLADEPVQVSWSGAILTRSEPLREALAAALNALHPGFELVPPVGDALDGARLLADLRRDHPLSPLTSKTTLAQEEPA